MRARIAIELSLVLSLVLVGSACVSVRTPRIDARGPLRVASPDAVDALLARGPVPHPSVRHVDPPAGGVARPRAGDRDGYGMRLSPELASAYDALLDGRLPEALRAFDAVRAETSDPLVLWRVAYLRSLALIGAGRAADALDAVRESAAREIAWAGDDRASRALRGEVHIWLEDYAAAKRDFTSVLALIGDWALPTRFAGAPTNLPELYRSSAAQIRALSGMGIALFFEGAYAQAVPWLEAAEARANAVHFVVSHPIYGRVAPPEPESDYARGMVLATLASAELGRANALSDADADPRIAALYRAADATFDARGRAHATVTARAMQAWVLGKTGRTRAAERAADRATAMARERGLADLVWRVEALRGKLLLEGGRVDAAEVALRVADAGLDRVSGALATDGAKTRFGVGKGEVTRGLVDIDILRGDSAKLFDDLERGRARAFVDMLASSATKATALDPARHADLVARIEAIDAEVREARFELFAGNGAASDASRLAAIDRKLAERAAAVDALAAVDPELAAVFSVRTQSLEAIQARLRPRDLLAYALPALEGRTRWLLVTRDRAHVYAARARVSDLAAALDRFFASTGFGESGGVPASIDAEAQALEDDAAGGARGLSSARRSRGRAHALAQQQAAVTELTSLLEVDHFRGAELVYVVPAGPLHFVPWGAVELAAPVVVLPNASWLARTARPSQARAEGVVVVGDPEFGGALAPLPGARAEARGIATQYGVRPLIGEAATESALRAALERPARVLHLATHGVYRPGDPLDSAIFLSDGHRAEPLTAREIFARPLRAELVILSACETGLGKTVAGEDLLGLQRSFYLGGARAILSSLWPVDDRGTRAFMQAFHAELAHADFATAWLRAKEQLAQSGAPPSVYGAFVLAGSR